MWHLAEEFVSDFTAQSASSGWIVDLVEDGEFIYFVKPIGAQLEAGLGMDLTRRPFGLSLNPSVSVRNKLVSKLFAQFFGFDSGPASVSKSMSDLVRSSGRGSGSLWLVESEAKVSQAVLDVLSDVDIYGDPFFSLYTSTSDLIRHFEEVATTNLDFAQLALMYALVDNGEGVHLLLARLDEMAAQQPVLLAEQTRRFVSSFRSYFGLD